MFFDIYKTLCDSRGISPKKAAIEIGLSNSVTVKWKAGATPSGSTLAKIADYFGVTTDYLLGTETEKAPASDGERTVSDDDIKFALWGTREIDDDVLDQVKAFAKFARENRRDK